MDLAKNKPIKCPGCKTEFEPIRRNGMLLSRLCISCIATKAKTKLKKEKRQKLRQQKEQLKTKSQWLNELQKVFNHFIRLRDAGKPCISCGQSLKGKFDAGHYFSVGAYPNLRFNEDNVHGQCVECNRHKHGNINEYAIRIKERIGFDRCHKLLSHRNELLHLDVPDIKDLLRLYKQKMEKLK